MLKKLEKSIREFLNEIIQEPLDEATKRNIKNFVNTQLIELMNVGKIRSDFEIEITKYVLIVNGYTSNDDFFTLKITF